MVLLKFRSETLIEWGIQLCIQRVPTWHTFGAPLSKKNNKYMKKHDANINITYFHVFIVFRGEGPTKVCHMGTHWMCN